MESLEELQESIATELARFGSRIRAFMQLESAGGLLLLVATILAMLVKNSPLSDLYQSFLMISGEVRIGAVSVEKPLFLWVNDLWMAVFFFLVGMEIKREFLEGYLSDRKQLALPGIAALGGMLVPAVIYASLNRGDPADLQGWAIPTATDIAFALGVLALLGNRVPLTLKVFLMTLAILDDLGAIVVIAIFYTSNLSVTSLVLAGVVVAVLFALNRFKVTHPAAFVIAGIVLWVCVLKSGVHATLAGVVTALAIPGRASQPGQESMLRELIHMLHPWVAFAILPLFAFVNAGVALGGFDPNLLLGSVPLGIMLGLIVGKQLGVFGFIWIAVKVGIVRLPPGVAWRQLYGIAVLCGIGFTMSLFIGGLAFAEGGAGYDRSDRLAVLIASLICGLVGYVVLRVSATPNAEK